MDINITLPDNSVRKFNNELSGYDLASDIGRSLAKDAVCIEINGQLTDLNTLIKGRFKMSYIYIKRSNIPRCIKTFISSYTCSSCFKLISKHKVWRWPFN